MDKLLDNIKKGVSRAVSEAEKLTKVVASKTSNIVDVTKLNLSLNETESKIEKLYVKIGESIYTSHLQGTENGDEIDGICAEISELKAAADSIRGQIADLKNSVSCPDCGQYNDKSNGYCSKCGAGLSQNKTENSAIIEVTEFPED